jgi:hypothetical protein
MESRVILCHGNWKNARFDLSVLFRSISSALFQCLQCSATLADLIKIILVVPVSKKSDH